MTAESITTKDRINQVLEEIRVVVPGSQALLGFQLVALFSTGFASLPEGIKEVHLVSLGFIALATVFLMAPSAYHRIAYTGNSSPKVHLFASRMLIIAMLFLLSGLATDIWVATYVVVGTASAAWLASLACFAIGALFWFLYPVLVLLRK